MTAQQLIEELQQFNPEMRIFVNGYEGGYEDVTISEIREIALDVHTDEDWWYGRHEDAASELAKGKAIVKGIVL